MSTQELQLILDALRQISGDAAGAAQWWIVAHYGQGYFSSLLWFVGIVASVWTISSTVHKVVTREAEAKENESLAKHCGTEWAKFGKRVAQALGGEGTDYSYSRDEAKITAALMQAVQREAEKGGTT